MIDWSIIMYFVFPCALLARASATAVNAHVKKVTQLYMLSVGVKSLRAALSSLARSAFLLARSQFVK